MAGRESDEYATKYVHSFSPPLQDRVFFWSLLFSFFLSSFICTCTFTNSFYFVQCPLFFPHAFSSLDFSLLLCCCGAVFGWAGAFNGDLSAWQVGEVTNMDGSTYTLSLPLQDRVYFRLSLFPFFIVLALIFFFNLFLSLDFSLSLCCCGAVFNGATAFNGDLSAWQVGKVTTMQSSTYTLPSPLQDRVFFWLLLFPLLLSVAALILFLNTMLSPHFFSHPFLSLDFSLLLWCSVLDCWCLQWWSLHMAGRESDEHV